MKIPLQGKLVLEVLAYTADAMLAPALGGWLLQATPGWGLPLLLAAVAVLGLWPGRPGRPGAAPAG